MSLTPRRKEDQASHGRQGAAPPEARTPETTPGEADDRLPGEPQFDLAGATLAIDDGLLMVLGPEGDPVPPAAVAAIAVDRSEASLAFEDGTKVPVGRVADVLEAQAHGRLGPAGDEARGWLEAMLGLGPAPAMASDDELDAERDGLEITLFGNELVVSTAAGNSFVIAATRPGGSEPAAAQLALGDGTPVGLDDLLMRLRGAAGLDAAEPAAAELALPGCCFASDGKVLTLTTAQGETFIFTEAGSDTERGVALYTPEGENATFAGLADALGLGDASPEPLAASVDVEVAPEESDEVQQAAQTTALADDGAADPESAPLSEAGIEVTEREQAQADVPVEPSAPVWDEETDDPEDGAGEADDDELILGEDAPAPPAAAAGIDGEVATETEEDAPGDAPVNELPRTTIPVACRLDDPANVAIVLISGIPAGAALSAGSDNGDGCWMLSPDQLDALTITLPGDAPGPLTLETRLITIDDRDGAMSTSARKVVAAREGGGSAARPTEPEVGIRLDLDAVIHEAAGAEPMSALVVSGLPTGAELSAGLFDDAIRSWVVKPTELNDLRLLPGTSSDGPFELRVTVVTMDRSTGKPSATKRRIEVGPSPPPTVDLTDRPVERVGGVGFFRPLSERRRRDLPR